MKNFLFDKFNTFTREVYHEFYRNITRNMPSNAPDTLDPLIWGFEDNGLWFIASDEARFYENDGTIHAISTRYTDSYVTNYRALASSLTSLRSLNLSETETLTLDEGTTVYYAKFLSPKSELGLTISAKMLTQETDNNSKLLEDIINDYVYKIYQGLKTVGNVGPSKNTPEDLFFDSEGPYLGILHDFSASFNESVDNIIAGSMRPSDKLPKDVVDTLIEQGCVKWQALKN